ncbi:hypothetical protein A3K93_09185 [Acinetobacter sp. NCu2D-2]|nr:NF038215 family lipoprotein [Acinetobacter sp. NCu2D-2]ANF82347.1 hypothetical protein A3K93_09185 [Acinetobacter sp. NCu2D-2]
MKIQCILFIVCLSYFMAACDQKDSLNQPKTQTRTMIIGGVPVHDHDYQLLADNVSTEPKQTTRY